MDNYNTTQFVSDLKELRITLSDIQIQQFLTYYEMLVEYNKVMNLTAITEYEEVMKKHFVDSLTLIKAYDITQEVSIIDIGTGAGFPGLALKIAFPNLSIKYPAKHCTPPILPLLALILPLYFVFPIKFFSVPSCPAIGNVA